MRQIELSIDVGDAVGLGVPARVLASVVLPEPEALPERPLVCVALPSSSYARGYYTCALPGAGEAGAQAAYHVERGWIFVALDWLGCDAASGIDPEDLGYGALTAAAHAAQAEILLRLANGVLEPGYPPVGRPCVIGIGQSLGGGLLIYQQARHGGFDGIGVLGFSAIHAHPSTPPGGEPVVVAWYPRDASLEECREPLNAAGIDPDVALPAWYAHRTPQRAARSSLTPGVVASEAAAIDVPVLAAMGVRDLVPDPHNEPRAYASARSVDVFVCPRMGHMHNMAGTRALLWERIHLFGEWCAAMKGQ